MRGEEKILISFLSKFQRQEEEAERPGHTQEEARLEKKGRNKIRQFNFELTFNPFLPTGQFMAPKLIISIKCLIDVLFFKVLF